MDPFIAPDCTTCANFGLIFWDFQNFEILGGESLFQLNKINSIIIENLMDLQWNFTREKVMRTCIYDARETDCQSLVPFMVWHKWEYTIIKNQRENNFYIVE